MGESIEPKQFRDLLGLLSELQRLHERLTQLGRAKLQALRQADTEAIRESAPVEQDVAGRIQQFEGFRRQLMDAIGESLGLPPRTARALPVSQLLPRLPAGQRAVLQEAAGRLREAVLRADEVNHTVGAVSAKVLDHLGRVLRSVSPANEGPTGYRGDGRVQAGCDPRILETVG